MLSFFMNPLMLFGLLGLALPVLAHMLSKKKYDIVEWGAMQFLELGRNARRKIRLEQLLLLLLRMGLIALIAIALARPWAEGGVFSKVASKQNRDVVIIIDGSYSMGWEAKSTTPHVAAIRWARSFLETLQPGDTIALIDARDQARLVIESPTSDFDRVRRELDAIPAPSGTSNLAEAMRKSVQLLSGTSNLSREVVVITDGQAKGWKPQDKNIWSLYDKMLDEPSVKPRTWVVEVGEQDTGKKMNFNLEQLQLSRELSSVGYPIRIKTNIHFSGGKTPTSRKVFFEVDGQRLADKTQIKTISPDGEVSVEFEYSFNTAGSHLVSVVIEKDNLPGDNRADAAITVTEAIPVLLVDGDPRPGKPLIESETVFAASALTPEENKAPWVKAEVVYWKKLDAKPVLDNKLDNLADYEAIFLANVPTFTDQQIKKLQEYVLNGGGLFFALGDKVNANHYNGKLFANGQGLLPVSLGAVKEKDPDTKEELQVTDASLNAPWLSRFKSQYDGGFVDTRYNQRWLMTVPKKKAGKSSDLAAPVVSASLNTGDPFLVTQKQGQGHVIVMSVPLDADWGSFQAKQDFTPFLHESVFFLASSRPAHNVSIGTPLIVAVAEDADVKQHVFFKPGGKTIAAIPGGIVNGLKLLRLNDTSLPGIYQFRKKTKDDRPDPESLPEYFVVNFDRSESELAPLSKEDSAALIEDGDGDEETKRMGFFRTLEELTAEMFKDNSRAEFWYLLLLAFLGILVFEVVMTRRLVQGGHAVLNDESASQGGSEPPPLPPGQSNFEHGDNDFLPDPNLSPVGGGKS
jgi:hypothetical protein